jgi:hypothetical protein
MKILIIRASEDERGVRVEEDSVDTLSMCLNSSENMTRGDIPNEASFITTTRD